MINSERKRNLARLGILALVVLSLLLGVSLIIRALFTRQDPVDLQNPVRSAQEDRVRWLPKLEFSPKFQHYSGYLEADEKRDRHWHYWFVESQSKPAEDPLVLWLNGGPGCSSLLGLLTEIGPFAMGQDGRIRENPHAWNKRANVLFMESPAGVGFSYALNGSLASNDDTTAKQNYQALKSFMEKFPHFKNRSLYLTGESYASVYLTTLAVLLEQDEDMNLKGVAVGNGCLDSFDFKQSLVFYGYFHGLLGEEVWQDFNKACCNGEVPDHNKCKSWRMDRYTICRMTIERAVDTILDSGLNPYNLYERCFHQQQKVTPAVSVIRGELFDRISYEESGPTCLDFASTINYLRRPDVLEALHVPDGLPQFTACNRAIRYVKIYQEKAAGLRPHFQKLLDSPKQLRLLIYSGDTDLQCNHLGDDWFVRDLDRKQTSAQLPWHLDDQVAGFFKVYEGLTFATVKGAGHMAPADRPAETLHLFHSFLEDRKLD